ncbi:MAG: hypothetical protein KFH87_12710 [Bacteroidetes bacterium]|nr:hypothetical protein [Bacteroidota bacterium]
MLLVLGVFIALRAEGDEILFRMLGVPVTTEALTTAGTTVVRLLAVACASLLFTLLVPMSHIVAGLRALRLPQAMIAVTWLTERFLVLLAADARRLMEGVRARSAALPLPRRIIVASRISGTFLVRAVSRSERMADAMTARHFDGRIPLHPTQRWVVRDTVSVVLTLVVIFFALLY